MRKDVQFATERVDGANDEEACDPAGQTEASDDGESISALFGSALDGSCASQDRRFDMIEMTRISARVDDDEDDGASDGAMLLAGGDSIAHANRPRARCFCATVRCMVCSVVCWG